MGEGPGVVSWLEGEEGGRLRHRDEPRDRIVQGRGGVLLRAGQGQVQVKNGMGQREAKRVVVVSSK